MGDIGKKIKIIEKFLKLKRYDFVCDYFVDTDEDNEIDVMLHISDEVLYQEERAVLLVRRIKDHVKNDIKTYLGFDVWVGNIVKECYGK